MQVVRNVFRALLGGGRKVQDDGSVCVDGCCGMGPPDYLEYLQGGQYWYLRAYPRGFGKRAKRSCMRKSLRYYKNAYKALKTCRFDDKNGKINAKFKTLFLVGTAHRSLCDDEKIMKTLDRLTNLMLYEMTDDMIDEYDLAVMGLQASSLITMYRTGYPASKLAEAREILQSIEETDPEAFEKMPQNFVQSHFHYKGLLNLIEGRLEDAREALQASMDVFEVRSEEGGDILDDFDKAFTLWTKKLLAKTEKKIIRAASQAVPNVTEEDIEDAVNADKIETDAIDKMETEVTTYGNIITNEIQEADEMVMVEKSKDD